MTDKITNLTLKAQVDQGLAAQGVKALRDIQAASDAAQKSLLQINENAAKDSNEFTRLSEVSKIIGRDTAIHDLAGQFVNLGTATKDYETQLINLRRALHDVGAESSEIDKATRSFKELQAEAEGAQGSIDLGGLSRLRGVGRAANQLGLPGAMEIQKIGDVGIIIKQLSSASEAAGTSILGTTVAFGGMEIALGPLLLVVGAVALAVLDLKLAFDLLKKGTDDAVAAEKAKFDQQQKQDEQDRQNRSASRSTSTEQNQQNADDAFADAFKKSKEIADKKAEIAQTEIKLSSETGGEAVNFDVYATSGVLEQQKKELADLEKQQNDFYASSENAAKNLAPAIKKNEDLKKVQDDLLKSGDDLVKMRQQEQQDINLTAKAAQDKIAALKVDTAATTEARDSLIKSGDTSKAVTDKIAAYNDTLKKNGDEQKYLTDTALPLIKAREDETQATKDADKALNEYTKSLSQSAQIGREIDKTEGDRRKQVKQEAEDDLRAAHRTAVEKDYQARIDEAKQTESIQAVRDKRDQDEQTAEEKAKEERGKIDQSFFDAELKAYQNYIQAEKDQTDRANLQRLRTLEDAQTDLKSLAAQGDVAGFIERSNRAKTDLKRQQEDNNLAQQKLQQDYEKQIDAARSARAKQLNDLNASLEKERQTRNAAADQRIRDIQQQGQQANNRSTQLEQELNNIREQWRKDDLNRQRALEEQNYEDRLALQQEKQAEILAQEQSFWSQYKANLQASGVEIQGTGDVRAYATPNATGITYVPHDNYLTRLHEGERVLNRRENNAYTYGKQSGGDTYQVSVQNTVGDVATKSMLDEYQEVTVGGIKQALRDAKGRGD